MPIIIDEVQAEIMPEREAASAPPAAPSGQGRDEVDPLERLRQLQERLKTRQARLQAD